MSLNFEPVYSLSLTVSQTLRSVHPQSPRDWRRQLGSLQRREGSRGVRRRRDAQVCVCVLFQAGVKGRFTTYHAWGARIYDLSRIDLGDWEHGLWMGVMRYHAVGGILGLWHTSGVCTVLESFFSDMAGYES